jgi:predicted acyl esterase
MDLYIAVKKLDRDGEIIAFPFANVLEHGPLALGWLRVSHRAIDPERSTDERPWHPHVTLEPLSEGEPVAVDIEIWPSGTRFAAGEGLRLAVRGSDHYTGAFMSRHVESHNAGTHVLHAGGQFDSQLVFPVLAVEDGAPDWGDA